MFSEDGSVLWVGAVGHEREVHIEKDGDKWRVSTQDWQMIGKLLWNTFSYVYTCSADRGLG